MAQLVLGTAQLGLNYGINNTSGKPDLKTAYHILDLAIDRGVTSFDTAAAYGNAEEILGEYFKKRQPNIELDVTTKLVPTFEVSESKNLRLQLEHELYKSLERLRLETVNSYLMHNPKHMYNEELVEILCMLKSKGFVKKLGVSVYNPTDAQFAAESDFIDHIQIPYSVLDQRLHRGPFFEIVKKKKKVVHARSAFLQGLLFMDPNRLPKHLEVAGPFLNKLRKLSAEFDISVHAMALLFSKSNESITHTIFGADNCEQLSKNVDIFKAMSLDAQLIESIQSEFREVDSYLIDPSRWS